MLFYIKLSLQRYQLCFVRMKVSDNIPKNRYSQFPTKWPILVHNSVNFSSILIYYGSYEGFADIWCALWPFELIRCKNAPCVKLLGGESRVWSALVECVSLISFSWNNAWLFNIFSSNSIGWNQLSLEMRLKINLINLFIQCDRLRYDWFSTWFDYFFFLDWSRWQIFSYKYQSNWLTSNRLNWIEMSYNSLIRLPSV